MGEKCEERQLLTFAVTTFRNSLMAPKKPSEEELSCL